jgi:hypothetical protein
MARSRKPHKQPPPEFIKELAEGLGRVVIAASQIEHFLGIVIAEMLKLTRMKHRTLIIPMSIANKISLLRQLGKEYLSPADRKILKSLLKEIEDCAGIRNELIHGFYGVKRGRFALITHSGEARFSGQAVLWGPKDLQALAKRMISASNTAPQIQRRFPKVLRLPKSRKPTAASARA